MESSYNAMLVNSLPKSGTHLINKLLDQLEYKFSGIGFSSASIYGRHALIKSILRGPCLGQPCIEVGLDVAACVRQTWVERSLSKLTDKSYCGGHLPYTDSMYQLLSQFDVKTIHMLRDPRDVLLSWAHYVPKVNWHYGRVGLSGCSLDERVKKILKGYQSGPFVIESFASILNRSNGWAGKSNILIVRFEELVGPHGGGTEQSQRKSIQDVATFLGMADVQMDRIEKGLFGGTKVFRKGKEGSWREELSESIKDEMNDNLGQIITQMGYEL